MQKRILVCPLNWGLGHASRCIPIIRKLIEEGHTVVIAADKKPLKLLQLEFPNLEFIVFEGYEMHYSKHFLWVKLVASIPSMIKGILKEHLTLRNIIKQHHIDVVISDNRYGCWNKEVYSVFISHQLFIQTPILKSLVAKINFWFLSRYNQVWVPDLAGSLNLSGALSHGEKTPNNIVYIGPLSRFASAQKLKTNVIKYDLCILLSGPEPQRSILENRVIAELKGLKLKTVFVRGLTDSNKTLESSELSASFNHLSSEKLSELISCSKTVLCRSGYSSIMDLAALGKKAIFVPTPGQTEQVYLAEYFSAKGISYFQLQPNFNLAEALNEIQNYKGFENYLNTSHYKLPQQLIR
ncbi:MAG: glycosyltransferase [Bacteroidetes bacterium]|nr:glycosyltransferase [Bacteroidota bacterium]